MELIKSNAKEITLTGEEVHVKFASAYPYFWVRNDGGETVLMSLSPNISEGGDGVVSVLAGGSAGTMHGFNSTRSDLYLSGSGKVQVMGTYTPENPFRNAGKGGEDGGSSITVDTLLSAASENPVQNKVITEALNTKISFSSISLSDDKKTTQTRYCKVAELKSKTYNSNGSYTFQIEISFGVLGNMTAEQLLQCRITQYTVMTALDYNGDWQQDRLLFYRNNEQSSGSDVYLVCRSNKMPLEIWIGSHNNSDWQAASMRVLFANTNTSEVVVFSPPYNWITALPTSLFTKTPTLLQ